MHDIPGRRCAWRHRVVAHGRSSRRIDQDGVRSRASKDLEREEGRSPTFRKREIPSGRGLGRRSEQRWWHAARLSEHPGSDRLRHTSRQRSLLAGHPLQSPTTIAGVQIAPLLAADQVTATAPVQTGVIAAFECSSQPPCTQVLRRPPESALRAADALLFVKRRLAWR
jgi:hypothetical protein